MTNKSLKPNIFIMLLKWLSSAVLCVVAYKNEKQIGNI